VKSRPAFLAAAAVLFLGGATVVIAVSFQPRSGSGPSTSNAVLEAVVAVIAILGSFLVAERFLETQRLDVLALLAGLITLCGTGVVLTASRQSFAGGHTAPTWDALIASAVGYSCVAAAALVPMRIVRRGEVALGLVLVASAAGVALGRAIVYAWSIEAQPAARTPVVAVDVLTGLALAAAAIGFALRTRREAGSFGAWLCIGITLGACSRFADVLAASPFDDAITPSQVLRLLFYTVILGGAFHETIAWWQRRAETAALGEQRRIARDLHDGVSQELAFIVREGEAAALPRPILAAAKRALAESRRTVTEAVPLDDEPLLTTLVRSTTDVATRAGAEIQFDVATGLSVTQQLRETLARIAREAVVNATSHGHARSIRVSLLSARGLRLSVADDGAGFAPRDDATGCFGLEIMRERAEDLGGRLAVHSQPGEGTEVEAVFP
jgi:signal transduction histidine kinase